MADTTLPDGARTDKTSGSPTLENGDPFNATPNRRPNKFSSLDSNLFAAYNNSSPATAKRALETDISKTDREIQDASDLETTLIKKKTELGERLKEVEEKQGSQEIGPDLKQKLTDLEKEYKDVSRDQPRQSHIRSRISSSEMNNTDATPKGYTMEAQPSPARSQTQVKRQRPQSSNRVHDIELATEISTSLLSQVRNLQNLVAEKDEALKKANEESAQLQSDVATFNHRLRGLDDNEQRYKDENWNLETQVQDLSAQLKDAAAREQKLSHALSSSKNDKSAVDREHDDLRQVHNKLSEDHEALRRQHELDLSAMRRDMSDGETERESLHSRIEELVSHNQELAKAAAYRLQPNQAVEESNESTETSFVDVGQATPESSPPPSPTKATPRHGALESETLRSSLHHAHRMIQNLKNNIHREKTEKVEIKRMLQDARDDLESRRNDGGAATANAGKKRKPLQDSKKPSVGKLGGAKGPNEEIIDDPSWEEYNDSPRRGHGKSDSHDMTTDASDAFATADEKNSATDTDAFMTGAESIAGDTEDELTETEAPNKPRVTSLASRKSANRGSFGSTASDEGDPFDLSTPSPRQPISRLRLGKGGLRKASESTSAKSSPASVGSNQSVIRSNQNLAAELQDFDDVSVAGSTPSRKSAFSREQTPAQGVAASRGQTPLREITPASEDPSPQLQRHETVRQSIESKPSMVDSSMMTEPLKSDSPKSPAATGGIAGSAMGAAAGWFASKVTGQPSESNQQDANRESPAPSTPSTTLQDARGKETPIKKVVPKFSLASISSQSIEPIVPPAPPAGVVSSVPTTEHTSAATREFHPEKDESSVSQKQALLNGILSRAQNRVDNATEGGEKEKGEEFEPFKISIAGRDVKPRRLGVAKPDHPKEMVNEGTDHISHVSKEQQRDSAFEEPTLQFESDDSKGKSKRPISGDIDPSFRPTSSALARDPATWPSGMRLPSSTMVDSSTQTSAGETTDLPKKTAKKPAEPFGIISVSSPASRSSTSKTGSTGSLPDPNVAKTKRPVSSIRRGGSPPPPPLPPDHKEMIALASRNSSMVGGAPPPQMLSTRSQSQQRPQTPNNTAQNLGRAMSRNRTTSFAGRSDITRRSSVSSFASELDERFNTANLGYHNVEPFHEQGTDPRMILAITQTMIGEFLWKYTRKAGRGEHSEKRHKRFFWIHPYTRTLYWSNGDPSAGRNELKAKSVSIEAVRVLSDENPMPPGLHPKSIMVVTPGRSIKFTAPTGQRHETWFNALSYLLLRNAPDQQDATQPGDVNFSNSGGGGYDPSNTMTSLTSEDVSEFNPTLYSRGPERASSRMSRSSLYQAFNSSKVGNRSSSTLTPRPNRTSMPTGQSSQASLPSLAVRQSQAASMRSDPYAESPVTAKRTSNTYSQPPGTPTPGPATTNHIHRISEGDGGLEAPGLQDEFFATPQSDMTAPAAFESQATIDTEKTPTPQPEFKKPARPFSTSTANTSASNVTSSPASKATNKDKGRRLSSFTSRLRPPSLASLIGRGGKGGSRNSDVSAPESQQSSTSNRNDIAHHSQHSVTSHPDSEANGHSRNKTLENVRACCDGKHDVGDLSHEHTHGGHIGRSSGSRSRSRASMGSLR
ncbi:MAG: hypothetical protein M1831_007105 [Alyxoria varia]|nr:MAG: hypothetical protein M1831_007105 [Alyxoria varia]